MAAMAPVEEQAAAGPPPRLPTLPVSDGRGVMEAFVDRGAASGASTDRLPVVELRPFMNQEWRPSRSLPDYYDRSGTSMSNSSRRDGGGSGGYPDAASLGLMNQKSNTEFGSRTSLSGERRDALRPRLREGKPVDTSHDGMFVTTLDREQTTLQEMHAKAAGASTGPSTQTASIVRSLSDGELVRLREMRVKGQRMENLPPKLSMLYVTPWEYYRMHRSYEIPQCTEPGATVQNATAIMDHLEMRYDALENVHIDDNIYDTFDRSNTLPSIRVTNALTRRKRHRKPRQSATSSSAPGSAVAPPAYRLGVANSLDVLRNFGKPARVETHLTMHLKHTLNQLRRTHNSQATLQSAAAGAGLLGHAPGLGQGRPVGLRTSSTPTYGEAMLRVGIQANNAPRISDRNIRAALPSASAPDTLSRSTTHIRSEIYGQMPSVEQPEPMSSRTHAENTGYEPLVEQPMTPPSTAELLNGNQVPEEDASVSMTPRKSRRSREPQDPNDPSPRDHHSNSSSTKSPRTKSRRSKSRRAAEAAKLQSETPTAEDAASLRRTQESSVTFLDEQLDGEQRTESMGTAYGEHSDMLASTHGDQPAPDGRSSKASRSGTRATPVHIPNSSAGSRNEAHPEVSGEDDVQGDHVRPEDNSERRGDINALVNISPNGDIQVGGNSMGVIKIGTDGTLTLGGKPMGVVKVGANGNIEIQPCIGKPRTDGNDKGGNDDVCNDNVGNDNVGNDNVGNDNVGNDNVGNDNVGNDNVGNDNVGNDNVAGNNDDNATGEPTESMKTEGDKTRDVVDNNDDVKEVGSSGSSGDIGSAPVIIPTQDGDTAAAIVIPVGIDVDPSMDTQPESWGDMEVDPVTVIETSRADSEPSGNIGGGDTAPGSDIGDIVVGPDGHLHMAGKSLGAIQFGDSGEIKLGGKTIAALAVDPDGIIAIKKTVEVRGSSRQSRVSFSPEATGGVQSGRASTGTALEASMGAAAPQEESSSDLNNNTGEPIPAQGMKSPGGADLQEEGQQQVTTAPGQAPGEEPSSTPAPTTAAAADTEATDDVTGGGQHKATPPGGDVTFRKMQTKSAASKASSQGYRGDDVYLTTWDQKTETESVRPDTVLTIREEV